MSTNQENKLRVVLPPISSLPDVPPSPPSTVAVNNSKMFFTGTISSDPRMNILPQNSNHNNCHTINYTPLQPQRPYGYHHQHHQHSSNSNNHSNFNLPSLFPSQDRSNVYNWPGYYNDNYSLLSPPLNNSYSNNDYNSNYNNDHSDDNNFYNSSSSWFNNHDEAIDADEDDEEGEEYYDVYEDDVDYDYDDEYSFSSHHDISHPHQNIMPMTPATLLTPLLHNDENDDNNEIIDKHDQSYSLNTILNGGNPFYEPSHYDNDNADGGGGDRINFDCSKEIVDELPNDSEENSACHQDDESLGNKRIKRFRSFPFFTLLSLSTLLIASFSLCGSSSNRKIERRRR